MNKLQVAAVDDSGQMYVFDMIDGTKLRQHMLPGRNGGKICIYPDGEYFFLAVQSGEVLAMKWDGSYKILTTVQDAKNLALSPTGKYMAVSGSRGIEVWELPDGAKVKARNKLTTFKQHNGTVTALKFADNDSIFSGGTDQLLYHWKARNGEIIQCCEGHTSEVTGIAFKTYTRVVTCAGKGDGSAKVWRTDLGAELISTPPGNRGLSAIALALEVPQLFTGSSGGIVCQYALTNNEQKLVWEFDTDDASITDMWVSDDANYLLVASDDGTIFLWDVQKKTPIQVAFTKKGGISFDVFRTPVEKVR